MYPNCRLCPFCLGRAELGLLFPPSTPSSHRCSSAPLLAVADEHGLLQESRKGCGAVQPSTLNAVAVFSPSGRARRAALGPLPRCLRSSSAAAAPLRCWWSLTSTACLKRGSVSVRPGSGTHSDCRCYLSAGLNWSRCPRAEPAGSLGLLPRCLRRPSAAAAPLRCGWSSTNIAGSKKGSPPVDHVPQLPSLSLRFRAG
jgi:hypothetical protein